MCGAYGTLAANQAGIVSGIPVCGNEIFVRMWGIPRCCHFSGVLTTLAHQSLRLLVRPCTDYITTLLRGDHNCVEPFEKPFFFLIAWQMLSHFFSSLCAVTYKTVCAWVRACVCVFVRTRNLRDRVRETRGESSRNKIPLLGQLFFFFLIFSSLVVSVLAALNEPRIFCFSYLYLL